MGATITNTATMATTNSIELLTRTANAAALVSPEDPGKTLVGYLRAHLNHLPAGDYLALLGYVEMNQLREKKTMQGIRPACAT
jgi:hypothetical protein